MRIIKCTVMGCDTFMGTGDVVPEHARCIPCSIGQRIYEGRDPAGTWMAVSDKDLVDFLDDPPPAPPPSPGLLFSLGFTGSIAMAILLFVEDTAACLVAVTFWWGFMNHMRKSLRSQAW